eukprot:8362847-Pyramimonas_sp.AAC.1
MYQVRNVPIQPIEWKRFQLILRTTKGRFQLILRRAERFSYTYVAPTDCYKEETFQAIQWHSVVEDGVVDLEWDGLHVQCEDVAHLARHVD